MKVQMVWEKDNRLVLTCSGSMDWASQDELVQPFAGTLDGREEPHVLVDLESVDFISSAGLGTLLQVRRLVGERSGRLVLAGASPMVAQLFRTVGLDRYVPMAENADTGRAILAQAEK